MECHDNVTLPPPPWSDLPPELLCQIGRCLQSSSIDVLRFRAVCHSWRSSLSSSFTGNETHKIRPFLSPNLPIKIPPYPFLPSSRPGRGSFHLIAATTFLLHPTTINGGPLENSAPSLLTVEELNPRRLCFREPLSELYRRIRGKESLPMLFDLFDFHLSIVSEHFVVRHLSVRQNASEKAGTREVLEPSAIDNILSVKAILLTNPSVAVVLFRDGKLGFLRLDNMEWKLIDDEEEDDDNDYDDDDDENESLHYDDIVKLGNKNIIYGVDRDGAAFFITFNRESGSLDQLLLTSPIVGCYGRRKRLVVDPSHERLFLVCNHPIISSKFTFTVYKLELGQQKWEKVMNLGDQIFFITVDFSLCLSAWDFHGLAKTSHLCNPGNCIIFARGSFSRYEFDLEDTLFFKGSSTQMNIGMFRLDDDCAVGFLEPGYETLLFPPMNWFLPKAS